MESLDLAYKLVDLKIKSKAPDQIYFMSQVFQEHSHCYDKRRKIENENYIDDLRLECKNGLSKYILRKSSR